MADFTTLPAILAAPGEVHVRFLTPADGELLVDLMTRLSPESLYRRFHLADAEMTREEAYELLPAFLAVDGRDHVALLATVVEDGVEQAIGVARFKRDPGNPDAEAAVVVRDDWQRQGVGSTLLRQLAKAARAVGVQRFTAWVQGSNRAALGLIATIDAAVSHHPQGGEDLVIVNLVND